MRRRRAISLQTEQRFGDQEINRQSAGIHQGGNEGCRDQRGVDAETSRSHWNHSADNIRPDADRHHRQRHCDRQRRHWHFQERAPECDNRQQKAQNDAHQQFTHQHAPYIA